MTEVAGEVAGVAAVAVAAGVAAAVADNGRGPQRLRVATTITSTDNQ